MTSDSTSFIKKIDSFFMSTQFMLATFVLACFITVFRIETIGLILFTFLISLTLLFCEDIIASTFPFFITSMMMIKCYDSYDQFVKFAWIAVPAVLVIVLHFVIYRKPFVLGKSFWGLLAVAVAVTMGGLGKLYISDYLAPTSIYNVVGLGFGMVLVYLLMNSQFTCGKGYNLEDRFGHIMFMMGAFGCFMVLSHYIMNIDLVLETGKIIDFQWRNNISTFLMFTMPFPFYLSIKKSYLLWLGILCYICILLAGSRGGTIFGSIEFLVCAAFILHSDAKNRKKNIIIFLSLISVTIIFSGHLKDFFSITIHKIISSHEDVRVGLFKRAIEDFKSNPIFGRGIGYFGNNDLWEPRKFALNWYNSLPFQVLGSLGILGAIAYSYQLYIRIKILTSNMTTFNLTLSISYLGIFMMSLVNPGEFVAVPYEMLVVIMFIISEKSNGNCSVEKQPIHTKSGVSTKHRIENK